MSDEQMTEQDMLTMLAALPPERLEELERIGRHIGREVGHLLSEGRDHDTVAEELREPWEIVARLGIPRENVTDQAEELVRRQFLDHLRAPEGIFDCLKCKMIVLETVPGIVAAATVITAVLAPELAAAIVGALIAGGISVAVTAAAIALIIIGSIASTVAGPVCGLVGAC